MITIVILFLALLVTDAFGQITTKEDALTKSVATPVVLPVERSARPPRTGGSFGKEFDIPVDASGIITVEFDCDVSCLADPNKDFFLILDWQPDGVNWDTHTSVRLVGRTLNRDGSQATVPFGFSFNLDETKWLRGKKVRVRIVSNAAINIGATIGIEAKK